MVRKIADWSENTFVKKICRDPAHQPPGMIVLDPGVYEHECPTCHQVIVFSVPPKPRMEL